MAKAFANTLLVDATSNDPDEGRQQPAPAWLSELFWLFTGFLVYVGTAAASRWVWPNRAYVSFIVTLLTFVTWVVVAHKLKLLRRSESLPGWRGFMFRFLFNFVFFSSLMVTSDVLWTPRPLLISVTFACSVGFMFALATASSRT